MVINSPKFGIFNILFDKEDYEEILKYHWVISMVKSPRCDYEMYYAMSTRTKDHKCTLLHRLVMKCPKNKVVDHIDGNTLDNKKFNLRICTSTENKRNCKLYKNSTSGHKGVHWYPYHNFNKWQATISINHKQRTIGYFDTYDEAVKAREEAEKIYYGEFVR